MMGYLEVSLRPQRQHTQDYHTRYSWLVEVVYRLLYARRVNNKYLSGHLPYYDGVRVLAAASTHLWVFSLKLLLWRSGEHY